MSKESIEHFFKSVVSDMARRNEKVPVDKFEAKAESASGQLLAPDWFRYMITGRGPGKMPPVENILRWVEKYISQPVRENKDGTFSIVPFESVAFAIAVKIGNEGTQVWKGEKQGVDLLGAMESNMEELLKGIAESKALQIATSLSSAVKK
jgi:hypothetical protein